MQSKTDLSLLLKILKDDFCIDCISSTIPPQGMDSDVVIITDKDHKKYVIKLGDNTATELHSYELLKQYNLNIPLPKIYVTSTLNNKPFLVMEHIPYPLLEHASTETVHLYIPHLINSLRTIHSITSHKAGAIVINQADISWKDFLLSKFNGNLKNLDWNEIAMRKGLNKILIQRSVDNIITWITKTNMTYSNYSFLHTDFNQRNIFINPIDNTITGIIDWGEAMYGDPIFDFARIRMLIWHYNLGKEVENNYYQVMNYSPEQRNLDDLYWVCRVIEYLAYYYEDLNTFSLGRIKKHQDFLNYHFKL